MDRPIVDRVEEARSYVQAAERVVVLTGAGISTDSGIPDFRGPNGLWTKNPDAEKASTLSAYVGDPDLRRRNWARLAEGAMWAGREPNAGHRALVQLQERDTLLALITQNVDGLHQAAGIDEHLMIEIHGTTHKVRCLDCGETAPMERALERVRAGEHDPDCRSCGGMLKSATISFGQNLIVDDLARAEHVSTNCDVLLAVGTSLQVYPIAGVVPLAHRCGARVVIVNAEPTPFDDLADVVVNASISDTLPVICSEPLVDS